MECPDIVKGKEEMNPPLIGLTGRKYAGKTEAARILQDHGYKGADIAITEPMIDIAMPILKALGCIDYHERLSPNGTRKDEPLPGYPWLSGRKILQMIGKDVRDALSKPSDTPPEGNMHGTDGQLFYDMWDERLAGEDLKVNASVRYPFERDIIHVRGGIVWRIINPEAPAPDDEHPSERQDWVVDREIIAPHSKGIDYLRQQVEIALAEVGQ